MADEAETYLTKLSPSVEDWIAFNNDLFTTLRGDTPEHSPRYAPFVDVDEHAAQAGVNVEEYFDEISKRVGPLGQAALKLVHSDMDDAWHITVAFIEETQNS